MFTTKLDNTDFVRQRGAFGDATIEKATFNVVERGVRKSYRAVASQTGRTIIDALAVVILVTLGVLFLPQVSVLGGHGMIESYTFFAAATSVGGLVCLDHLVRPILKQINKQNQKRKIANQKRNQGIRYRPSGERYIVLEDDSSSESDADMPDLLNITEETNLWGQV